MADIPDVEKAYAAGLFDGEGCVQVYMKKSGSKKNGHKDRSLSTSFSVAGTDLRPLAWLKERYGGSMRVYENNGHSPRAIANWTIFGHQAEAFARDIHPYLIVKKEQVDLWWVARSMMYERGYRGKGIPEDEVAARRDLVERMKGLKRSA